MKLLENFKTMLPLTYQIKTKMPGKNLKCLVYLLEVGYSKLVVASSKMKWSCFRQLLERNPSSCHLSLSVFQS